MFYINSFFTINDKYFILMSLILYAICFSQFYSLIIYLSVVYLCKYLYHIVLFIYLFNFYAVWPSVLFPLCNKFVKKEDHQTPSITLQFKQNINLQHILVSFISLG